MANKPVLCLAVLKHSLTSGERAVGFAAPPEVFHALLLTTFDSYSLVSLHQVRSAEELQRLARERFGTMEDVVIEGPDVAVFGVKTTAVSPEPVLPPA